MEGGFLDMHKRKRTTCIAKGFTNIEQLTLKSQSKYGTATYGLPVIWDYDGFVYAFIRIDDATATQNVTRVTVTFHDLNETAFHTVEAAFYGEDDIGKYFVGNSYTNGVSGSFRLSAGMWYYRLKCYNSLGTVLFEEGDYPFEIKSSLITPSINSFNTDTNVISVSTGSTVARCCLSLERVNRDETFKGYSKFLRDYFYTCAMKGIESGKYYEPLSPTQFPLDNGAYIRRQANSHPAAVVVFDNRYRTTQGGSIYSANITEQQKTTCYNYAKAAIDALNATHSYGRIELDTEYLTMPSSLIMLRGDIDGNTTKINNYYCYTNYTYNVVIRFGIDDSMYSTAQETTGGNWSVWAWDGEPEAGIGESMSAIAIDKEASIPGMRLSSVVHEEILQSLGVGGDSYTEMNSLFFEVGNFMHPTYYNETDLAVYKQFYACESGWDVFDVMNNRDTAGLLYAQAASTVTFDLSKLKAGEYIARAWLVKEDETYSLHTSEFTFTKGTPRPSLFSWSSVVKQGAPAYRAVNEWNSFVNNIREVIVYRGNENDIMPNNTIQYGSAANQTWGDALANHAKVSTGNPILTAQKFNTCRYCIGSLVSTGVTTKVSKESLLLMSDLEKMVTSLNNIT